MMKRTVETLTIFVFVTGWAILAAVGFVSYLTNSALIRDSAAVARTHEALHSAERLSSNIASAESAVRGYAITGDARYRREYLNAELALNQLVPELQQSVSRTPSEAQAVAKLAPTVQKRVQLFRETVAAYDANGHQSAETLIASNRGLELSAEIYRYVRQIETEEKALLLARQERAASLGLLTRLVIWVGSTISLVILAVATIIVRRESQSRKRARQRMAIQYATTRLLSESSTLSQAASRLLPELALTLEFDSAELWILQPETQTLRCTDVWHAPLIPQSYADLTLSTPLQIDKAIPGRVYANQEPLWIEQVTPEDLPLGNAAVETLAPRTAVAVPVLIWPEIAGVLLLMTRSHLPLDRDMFQMLTTIGAQLGQFITRRRAVEGLQETTELQRAILQSANFSIIATDANGIIKVMNATAEHWLQYEARELVGRSTPVILHRSEEISVHAARLSDELGRKIESGVEALVAKARIGHVDENDWTYIRRDGSSFAVQLSVTALRNVSGAVSGFLLIGQDITERREIDRMKNEFISVVSHELRTPLTSVRGSLGLLAAGMLGTLSDKAKRMLQIGINNTDRLVRLINDILDIERLESGKVALERQQVSAESLLLQSIDSMRGIAERSEITLKRQSFDAILHADPDRVVQTLTNLISNAIKFSQPGQSVEVGGFSNGKVATLYVRDYGRGIPAERQSAIFERFQQVDASDSREKGGTGLGLAICRTIVQQHGGHIWVDSTPGKGSVFYFTLPLYEEIPAVMPSLEPSDAPKIMICDDDAWLRGIVSNLLRQAGYQPVAVSGAREMLDRIGTEKPAVLLLDLVMPGMSGWEALSVLRLDPSMAELRVIVLSGLDEDQQRGKATADVAGWVQKPFDARRLYQAISMVLPRHSRALVLSAADSPTTKKLSATLAKFDIRTLAADNAHEAAVSADQHRPSLLVLDLPAAGDECFEAVRLMRSHHMLHDLPVVVLTSDEVSEEERARLRLGDTLFISEKTESPLETNSELFGLLEKLTNETKEAPPDQKAHSAYR